MAVHLEQPFFLTSLFLLSREKMRIVGNIPHPALKISVFKMNMKWAVKFEGGLLEQTYKFRESDALNSLEAIEKLVDEKLVDDVMVTFKSMNNHLGACFKRYVAS